MDHINHCKCPDQKYFSTDTVDEQEELFDPSLPEMGARPDSAGSGGSLKDKMKSLKDKTAAKMKKGKVAPESDPAQLKNVEDGTPREDGEEGEEGESDEEEEYSLVTRDRADRHRFGAGGRCSPLRTRGGGRIPTEIP